VVGHGAGRDAHALIRAIAGCGSLLGLYLGRQPRAQAVRGARHRAGCRRRQCRGAESGYAGLATLDIKAPGKYRFALDAPAWIDVIADGGAMNPSGHQGAAGCTGPHKIVEFEFSVARRVTLQFSGADMPALRLTVTPSR
jgi:hypothetical protein